jgi:hypothetical protein
MFTLEQIIYVVPILGLTASIFYYTLNLRTANRTQQLQLETRQAQLYMGIINVFNSLEFRRQWHLVESATWNDSDDFHKIHPPGSDVLTAVVQHFTFFESIGSLVDKKLVDIHLIDGILAQAIVMTWRKYEQIIIADRINFHTPTMWIQFENLYNELSKREEFTASKVADFVEKTDNYPHFIP